MAEEMMKLIVEASKLTVDECKEALCLIKAKQLILEKKNKEFSPMMELKATILLSRVFPIATSNVDELIEFKKEMEKRAEKMVELGEIIFP